MQKAKAGRQAADRRQLEQEIHLVKAPGALAKEKQQKLKGEKRCRARLLAAYWTGAGRCGLSGRCTAALAVLASCALQLASVGVPGAR